MTKTLGEKYKHARKVMILPHLYEKLERMHDKSNLPINELVNMILDNNFKAQSKAGEDG